MAEAVGANVLELGISRVSPATEVRSGENSYTDLVLAGLLAQQGRSAAAAEWATGALCNLRPDSGRAVCLSRRPITRPSILRY